MKSMLSFLHPFLLHQAGRLLSEHSAKTKRERYKSFHNEMRRNLGLPPIPWSGK